MYVFIKVIIGKTNCYWHMCFFSICIKLVNIKNKAILNMYYNPLHIKSKEQKNYLKKLDSSKKTTVKLSTFQT